jgi:outer membrane immunogenic protein
MIRAFAIGLLAATAVSTAVSAADLIVEEPIYDAAVAANDWDGVYIGVFGGYAAGTANAFALDQDIDGWLAGAAIGANFTVSEAIVAGIVGDIAWTNIGGPISGAEGNLDWAASLRGKLGFNGGAFLPYLTGGLAATDLTLDNGVDPTVTTTFIGWTAGAGVEFAATDDLSIDLLYRYSDYGVQEITLGGTSDVTLTTHQVTAGLNWSF